MLTEPVGSISFLIENLKLNSENINDVVLCLTHKQVLHESKSIKDIDKLKHCEEIGKSTFSLILKKFIYNNFSKVDASIGIVHDVSKLKFLDLFSNHYLIYNYLIYKDPLSPKSKNLLIFQLIGYLYLTIGYSTTEELLVKSFSADELLITEDYLSILNNYLKGAEMDFIEIESTGMDHEKVFKYELTVDGKKIISNGNSKKTAKMNCAKLFCKKYLSSKDIIKLSSVKNEVKKKTRKQFVASETLNNWLNIKAREFQLAKTDILNAITHSSYANAFELDDNSNLRGMGSDIERILLTELIMNEHPTLNFIEKIDLVNYLHSNNKIYEELCISLDLKRYLLIGKGTSIDEKSTLSTIEYSIKAFIFYDFFSNNIIYSKYLVPIIIKIIKNIDIEHLNPGSKVQSFLQGLNLDNPDYSFTQVENNVFICAANFTLPNVNIQISEKANSKSDAKSLCDKELLNFFYGDFNGSLCVKKVQSQKNKVAVEGFINYLLLNRIELFADYITIYNYFSIHSAVSGDSEQFFNDNYNIINNLMLNFNDNTVIRIYNFIIDYLDKEFIVVHSDNLLAESIVKYIFNSLRKELSNDKQMFTLSIDETIDMLTVSNKETLINKLTTHPHLLNKVNNISQDIIEQVITSNPLSINYLKEVNRNNINTYFGSIGKYEFDFLKNSNIGPDTLVEVLQDYYYRLINSDSTTVSKVIDRIGFDLHIKAIFRSINVNKFFAATGYVYASGLKFIEKELNDLIVNNGEVTIIAGNLQKYSTGAVQTSMDIKTAEFLNHLISKGCKLKTFEDTFYHGKVYLFKSINQNILIVGSSNISRNAFYRNKEFDQLHIIKNDHSNEFLDWIETFDKECNEIAHLDLELFQETDHLFGTEATEIDLIKLSKDSFEKRVTTVQDELLRKRLLLWLSYNPSNIYDDIIISNNKYVAIEYSDRNILVFESFIYGNSYFVFYNTSINNLLRDIEGKSKAEIFEMSNMEKRGYHTREKLKLEIKIKSYFMY